jgi:hypothetical protein
MSSSQLTLKIPETDNLAWFNNFIAAILYSQYSRDLITNNQDILDKIKEIFDFSNDTTQNLEEIIRIASSNEPLISSNDDSLDYLTQDNEDEKIRTLNIDIQFYKYLLNHNKQLSAFILPKFLEFINSSCISIERYNGKNYIGLYDIVKYEKKTKIEKGLFGLNQKKIEEDYFELKDVKQRNIKKLYNQSKDYILINKWNNVHYPKIFDEILKMDQDDDNEGIDNKYRLSSTYKKKEDLNITDNIDDIIIYNDYYYKLDSFIISNNNEDKSNSPQLITALTYDEQKYAYINNYCVELNKLLLAQNEFKIHSLFPCDLIKGKIKISEKQDISTFNLNTGSNYTLVYVKLKKIADQEKEQLEADRKAKEKRDDEEKKRNAEQKAKQDEEKDKEAKFLRLAKLETDIEKKDDKLKKLERILAEEYKDDIGEMEKIITFSVKKDEFNELKKLLKEYINILKTADTEFNKNTFEDWIKKIYEIQNEINNNIRKFQALEAKSGNKNVPERLFISFYDNIILYLNRYILFIINLLSRKNTILLLKEEIKDLPNNKKINEILDAIAKLPKVEQIGKLNDLLVPTDAKIAQILDVISKMPTDAKLKKIEDLLKPTDAKLNQLLDAITKIPNDDLTKKIDAMQQLLLSKIQEQKSANSRTMQPEIAELKKQLETFTETSKRDQIKIIDDLNIKLDAMQQELLSKLQKQVIKSKSSKSKDNITLKQEISNLNQQLQLLEDIQTKLSGNIYNSQLLADMQEKLSNFAKKDTELIIQGVQDLLRSFNSEVIVKQTEKNNKIHNQIDTNIKEQLVLLKDIHTKLDKDVKSSSHKKDDKEISLLKVENAELKKQILILEDIQLKCKRQQKEYQRCNKHNTLPYKYIKFKEDELLDAIKDKFKSQKQPSSKIIIDFIFNYFEKNNKVMNVYIIEKYMGDIYDVMKIFNKRYNIEEIDIKQFYRLLASISIYSKYQNDIKKIFLK